MKNLLRRSRTVLPANYESHDGPAFSVIEVNCAVCEEPKVKALLWQNPKCAHPDIICLDCIRQYICVNLSNNQKDVKCMHHGCKRYLSEADILSALGGDEDMNELYAEYVKRQKPDMPNNVVVLNNLRQLESFSSFQGKSVSSGSLDLPLQPSRRQSKVMVVPQQQSMNRMSVMSPTARCKCIIL